MYACVSYKLDEVGMRYKWVVGSKYQIKGQWSITYTVP